MFPILAGLPSPKKHGELAGKSPCYPLEIINLHSWLFFFTIVMVVFGGVTGRYPKCRHVWSRRYIFPKPIIFCIYVEFWGVSINQKGWILDYPSSQTARDYTFGRSRKLCFVADAVYVISSSHEYNAPSTRKIMESLLDCQLHGNTLGSAAKPLENQWIVKVHGVPFIQKDKHIIYPLWTRVLATPKEYTNIKHPGSKFKTQHRHLSRTENLRTNWPLNDKTSLSLGKKHALQLIGWVIPFETYTHQI